MTTPTKMTTYKPIYKYVDAMTRAIDSSSATEDEKERMYQLYLETKKTQPPTLESREFKLSFSLGDLASGHPEMSYYDRGIDEMYYRHCSDEELDAIVWAGREFKFPIEFGYDAETKTFERYDTRIISETRWKKGDRWTLREVLKMMRYFYSAKRRGAYLKAMGDHTFFEGFVGNTYHCGS